MKMKLGDWGYNDKFEKFRIENDLEAFEVGRIFAEHKERYIVKTLKGEVEAEITGQMRHTSNNREEFPAVGDWVALTLYESGISLIHKVFPRFSVISRSYIGKLGEKQIIAANIDYGLIVQAADRDFNVNRLERYLTICNSSNVSPVIVLTKIDLIEEQGLYKILKHIKTRVKSVPIIPLSNHSRIGYEKLIKIIGKGKTYCLLGSSGVGKSTLLNNLSGKLIMRTNRISPSSNKGRHITSYRQLILLENGGLLIDNPGMREVGIGDATNGLEITFDEIINLALNCRFKNCTHTKEIGCAVLKAVKREEIDQKSFENYLKIEGENAHFESKIAEKRKKDKDFGRRLKDFKKRKNE